MKKIKMNGKYGAGKYVIVDDEDFERVIKHRWYVGDMGYAKKQFYGNGDGSFKTVKLHHFIFGKPPKGLVTDHINGNPLDNRKINLRFITQHKNSLNSKSPKTHANNPVSSIYRGVCFDKGTSRWKARVVYNYKEYWLGRFDTEKEAALAYNQAVKEIHGEYAKLNKV